MKSKIATAIVAVFVSFSHEVLADQSAIIAVRVDGPTIPKYGNNGSSVISEHWTTFKFPTELLEMGNYAGTKYYASYLTFAIKPARWDGETQGAWQTYLEQEVETEVYSMSGGSAIDRVTYRHKQEVADGNYYITIPEPKKRQDILMEFDHLGSFRVEHDTYPAAPNYGLDGSGRYVFRVEKQYAEFLIAVDNDSDFSDVEDWIENARRPNTFVGTLTRIIKESVSKHVSKDVIRKIKYRRSTVLGVRGSISTKGNSIHTASPGIIAFDWTLPNTNTLNMPMVFIENFDDATVDIYFDDDHLGQFLGSNYETNVMEILPLDISGYEGSNGILKVELNTTGTESAVVYIPDSIHLEVEEYFPVEHSSSNTAAGAFSFKSGKDQMYSLKRSTNLLNGAVSLEEVQGDGNTLVMNYDDSGSAVESAFFWVEKTPILYAPESLLPGSGMNILANGVLERTFYFGDGVFTNVTDSGWTAGTNEYVYWNGVASQLAVGYPGDPGSSTDFYLDWTNNVGGILSSSGAMNISTYSGYSYEYITNTVPLSLATVALAVGDVIKLYRHGELDATFTINSSGTFTAVGEAGSVAGNHSYTYENGVYSTLWIDYPIWEDSETTYFFDWQTASGGNLTAVGEENIGPGYATFEYIPY